MIYGKSVKEIHSVKDLRTLRINYLQNNTYRKADAPTDKSEDIFFSDFGNGSLIMLFRVVFLHCNFLLSVFINSILVENI